MPHLYKIGLKNFRVFKEQTNIEFAPLTILTGANNSGKSSVIKAIQLLKSNFVDGDSDSAFNLIFIADKHNLSGYHSVVKDLSKPLEITIPTVLKGINEILSMKLTYDIKADSSIDEGRLQKIELMSKDDKCIYKYDRSTSETSSTVDYLYFYEKLLCLITKMEEYKNALQDFRNQKTGKITHPVFKISNDNIINFKLPHSKLKYFPYPLIKNYLPEDFYVMKNKDGSTFPKFDADDFLGPSTFLIVALASGDIDFKNWTQNYAKLHADNDDKWYVIDKYLEIENQCSSEDIQALKIKLTKAMLAPLKSFEMKSEDSNNIYSNTIFESNVHIERIVDFLTDYFIPAIIEQHYSSSDIQTKLEKYVYLSDLLKDNRNINFLSEDFIDENISQLIHNTKKYLMPIYKLDAVRGNTQRLYTYKTQGTGINNLLFSVLKNNSNLQIRNNLFLKKWLKNFEINGDLEIENTVPGAGVTIRLGGRHLADFGYGLTQLVPILLEIVLISENSYRYIIDEEDIDTNFETSSVLIIEEPEANLHPKFQSMLADLFIDANKQFNIQFIIETHSEYLIRKLQFLTAKGEISPSDTSIYYFYNPKEIPANKSQVTKIELNKLGKMSHDFGPGFFDEADNLAIQLFNLNQQSQN